MIVAILFARVSGVFILALNAAIHSGEENRARVFVECLYPLCAADIFARASGECFRPLSAADIFAMASGVNLWPLSVADIFARVSGKCAWPLPRCAADILARVSGEIMRLLTGEGICTSSGLSGMGRYLVEGK